MRTSRRCRLFAKNLLSISCARLQMQTRFADAANQTMVELIRVLAELSAVLVVAAEAAARQALADKRPWTSRQLKKLVQSPCVRQRQPSPVRRLSSRIIPHIYRNQV